MTYVLHRYHMHNIGMQGQNSLKSFSYVTVRQFKAVVCVTGTQE